MTRTLSAYLLVFAFASTAAAQDLEPNNVCRTAPDAGVTASSGHHVVASRSLSTWKYPRS